MCNYLKFLGAAAMMLTLFATTSCNRDKPRFANEATPADQLSDAMGEDDETEEGSLEGIGRDSR